ncbi:uncharacterized protein LOC126334703 [Schistocerca gregaria]|uniref:uncharacterized protein LOC126334703 n=1 Tax=Schistocerca gregaria TaxID=7010 RepID=UPI00211F22D7|nr:uncharacterized protein LOC126334703 [Schistocerca gregaria]XP_049853166.1 uncharacterized protein LOC126334703 [Schistocerca gregaria]
MWTWSLLLLIVAVWGAAGEVLLHCDCALRGTNNQHVSIQCLSQEPEHRSNLQHPLFPDVQKKTTCEQVAARRLLPGYQLVAGVGLYRVYRTQRGFIDAENRCLRDGAHLAVPETPTEARAIADLLAAHRLHHAWVGIRRHAPFMSKFTTLLGDDVKKLAFHEWEEEGVVPLEDCCTLSGPRGGRGVGLSVWPCSRPLTFVCEQPAGAALPRGYWLAGDGSALRLHPQSDSRDAAAAACRGEAALLAVPRTDSLAEELLAALHEHNVTGDVFVGIHAEAGSGFLTDAGEPLELLDFKNWLPGHPQRSRDTRRCVCMETRGVLKVCDCELPLPFFCEIHF